MAKTKKRKKRQKNKTRKNIKNMNMIYALNFNEIPINTPTKLWTTNYFGYRKSIPVNKYKIIQSLDNNNKPTDYKKNKKLFDFAVDEYKNKLILESNHSEKSRKFIGKKLRRKLTRNNTEKIIKRLPVKKVEKIYESLMEKMRNSSKK